VQPYGHSPREATIIESFAAIEDAFEALTGCTSRARTSSRSGSGSRIARFERSSDRG
jgi:hypothetical protein